MKTLVVIFLAIFCAFTNGGQWSGASTKNSWSSNAASNSLSVSKHIPTFKYEGPLAVSPGVDETGAPLPVEDTPEVARLKASHLAAIAKAGGDIYPATGPDPWASYASSQSRSSGYGQQGGGHGGKKWKRSIEESHHHESQHESPEQEYYAKLAHDAAVNKAKNEIAAAVHQQKEKIQNSWSISTYAPKYTGPQALPGGYDKTGAPLPVEDTLEVALVKSKRLSALLKAGGDIFPAQDYEEISTDPWKSQNNDWPSQSSNGWASSSSNAWPSQSSSGWPSSSSSSNAWPSKSSNDWPSTSSSSNAWPSQSSSGWPSSSSSSNAWPSKSSNDWPSTSSSSNAWPSQSSSAWPSSSSSSNAWPTQSSNAWPSSSSTSNAWPSSPSSSNAWPSSSTNAWPSASNNAWEIPSYASQSHSKKWKRSIEESHHHESHHESPEQEYYAKLAHDAAVNKAKNEIAAAVHQQMKKIQNSWSHTPKYNGPQALPSGYDKTGAPLPVEDTLDVALVKSKQLDALLKAGGDIFPARHHPETSSDPWKSQNNDWPSSSSNAWPSQSSNAWPSKSSNAWPSQSSNAWPTQSSNAWPSKSSNAWPPQSSNAWPSHASNANSIRYHGPIALPPGYDINGAPLPVEDTPEVAALKYEHLQTQAKIAAERKQQWQPKW